MKQAKCGKIRSIWEQLVGSTWRLQSWKMNNKCMCKWCRNKRFKRKEDGRKQGGRYSWRMICLMQPELLKLWYEDWTQKKEGPVGCWEEVDPEELDVGGSDPIWKKYANHKMMSNVEWNYEDNYSPSKQSHDFIREKLRRQGRKAREAFRVARGFVEATIREKKGTCDVNNQYIKELEATKKQPRCSTNVVWELNQMRSPRILMFGLPNERLK